MPRFFGNVASIALVFSLLPLTVPGTASADDNLIELEVVSPVPVKRNGRNGNPDAESETILMRAGGQLTFHLSADWDDILGIGPIVSPYEEIEGGASWMNVLAEPGPSMGAVVFDDPDGFWSLGCEISNPSGNCIVPNDFVDELYLSFHPDRGDLDGVFNDSGFRYEFQWPRSSELRPEFGGPAINADASDGVDYGVDDDLPGLVLISDLGVGVVTTRNQPVFDPAGSDDLNPDFYVPVVPAKRRNLAGFLSSVGYEIRDNRGRVGITATMVTPRHLFTDVILRDACLGLIDFQNARCEGGAMQVSMFREPRRTNYTLRAFVVATPDVYSIPDDFNVVPNSHPDIIEDICGPDDDSLPDGIVDSHDATCMGYTVISNEVEINFSQVFINTVSVTEARFDEGTDVFIDFDNNGAFAPPGAIQPGGGGGGVRRF